MSDFILLLVVYSIGVLMGCVTTNFIHTRAGKFEIDQTGPHDIYRVNFDIPMEEIPKKKYLLLKVNKNAKLISELEEQINEQNSVI